jgi:regulator of protease activity HflC (stomatin/prohibitin superfamily)
MATNMRTPDFDLPQILRLGPSRFVLAVMSVLAITLAGTFYWWFVQRIEVGSDQLCILVRKVGDSLPGGAGNQVVLHPGLITKLGGKPGESFKGIVYEPLGQGRHFRDPFFWERRIIPVTTVASDEVGILVRRFGEPLPLGQAVTEKDAFERGPVREVLPPGRHNVNLLAYDVLRIKPVTIPAGHVGIQTLRSGKPPANPNQYVVASGELGVQPDVLPPGLYFNNPYERHVDVLDVRSHTLDLRGEQSIQFPSNDSFAIQLEATVEYAILKEKAPYVLVAIGDHAQVVNRILLPHMNSFSRIEGSKLFARDFIGGETRTAFQNRIFEQLRSIGADQGIEIRAVLIRRIVPPGEISGPISDRQVADQQVTRYQSEIKMARSESLLVEQEEKQKQNQAIGEANREVVTMITEAEQKKTVAVTDAQKRHEVAKLMLQAAKERAAAIVSRGDAAADVKRLEYEAKARPLRDAIGAFGDGETYAQFFFYQKLAPALKNVTDSTGGPFADIFRSLSAHTPSPLKPREPAAAAANPGGN